MGKDSVHRALKALKKRNQYPESDFWETEAGKAWLRRLVLATVYEFGIKSHHGAEKLSTFFKQLRVEQHIGVKDKFNTTTTEASRRRISKLPATT